MTVARYQSILRHYWGYDDFRGIQREIIESISSGKDTLGLMPTGGGKSVTFQVPAIGMDGVCIVITPLIALMKDQVDNLRRKGIRAAALYSGMSRNEMIVTLENCIFGGVKLLYVSPERLSSELFQAKLKRIKVSFITVDEAHCISQWGYDFRPAYLGIAKIRGLLAGSSRPDGTPSSPTRHVPVLALTATATPDVIDDIQERLGFSQKNVFRMSFERENLAYIVRERNDKEAELLHILRQMNACSIVYVRSRKRAKDIAELLCANGFSATYYHAGLDPAEKDKRQDEWQNGSKQTIVATNAFGMGIDKPDVRLVIHIDVPSSIEAYFQEAGRAGRDGKQSYAVLLYNSSDEQKLRKRVSDTFPPTEEVREIYEHLAYFYQMGVGSGGGKTFEFPIDRFSVPFHHYPIRINAALQILQRAGYLEYEQDPDTAARVMFKLDKHELYRLREQPPEEEAVIDALLRNYGGLFSGLVYIDESYVAQKAGLDRNQTYQILKNLGKKGIIDFIPRRNVPLITFTRDRVDGADIVISKEVYDDRKKQFEQRIQAITDYAKSRHACRSRLLLRYFGESKSKDCGQCDVCRTDKDEPEVRKAIRSHIMELLKDKEQHIITEIRDLPFDTALIEETLRDMCSEEELVLSGSFIRLN